MARVKIGEIIDYLEDDMNRALEDAHKRCFPGVPVDRNRLFREFVKEVGRKCSTWEQVPDRCVDAD